MLFMKQHVGGIDTEAIGRCATNHVAWHNSCYCIADASQSIKVASYRLRGKFGSTSDIGATMTAKDRPKKFGALFLKLKEK